MYGMATCSETVSDIECEPMFCASCGNRMLVSMWFTVQRSQDSGSYMSQ